MDRQPNEWLQSEGRLDCLRNEIASSIDLLEYSQSLGKVLIWWVRREVLKELNQGSSEFAELPIAEQLTCWAKLEWGHRLNELFLEKKDLLDIASFNILRVANHAVAMELFHRIKENESSFLSLAEKFSVESEKDKHPFKKNVRMGSLPHNIQGIIRSSQIGQLSKPLQLKNQFLLIRVEELIEAEMSDEIQNKLALDQFNVWASTIAGLARDRLM